MQKLVFFIDPGTPLYRDCKLDTNICNLYMNRFIIDEGAGHEIVKIYEIKELYKIVEEKERIGMGRTIFSNY